MPRAAAAVTYDRQTGRLEVPPGHAVRLTKIGYHAGAKDLVLNELVPARKTHIFALHPDKWESTFYSLTNKDPHKISFYAPQAIPVRPGTLIADMYLANQFQRGNAEAARLYQESVKPVEEADLAAYKLPELLIPQGASLGAGWREDLPDPKIRRILDFAEDRGLDLSTSIEQMNPWYIQVEELVDPAYVKGIAETLREAGEWPEAMPLPVVMGGTPMIMDGSHRTTAARVARLETIPVLVADADAFFKITDGFGIPRFDYVHSILPAVDPLMKENERKDEQGGRFKRRTAEPWDMDAFLETGE